MGGKEGEGLDGTLLAKVPKSHGQDKKCRSFLHIYLSLEQRSGPEVPSLREEVSSLGKICPARFWYCPLWPPVKNVRLQISSYPESIWCVPRIKSKSAYPLTPALTCFHRHSSSQGEVQACPQEGAPHQAQREPAPTPNPSPHHTPRGTVSQP